MVEPSRRLSVCRDPHDNKFFECATEAGAQYVVSEDKDILDVGEYEGIKTITADELIHLMSRK